MKFIIYILLLGIVGCTKPVLNKYNDLENENIKGRVKSIYQFSFSTKNIKHKNKSSHKQNDYSIFCFNKEGFITYENNEILRESPNKGNAYSYTYNNQVIKRINFGTNSSTYYYYGNGFCVLKTYKNNILRSKRIDIYEGKKLVSQKSFLYDLNKKKYRLDCHFIFKYNKKNQKINTERYELFYASNKKFLGWKETLTYSTLMKDYPIVQNIEIYDAVSKKIKRYTYKFAYKFDSQGNWIEKIYLGKGCLTGYKRKITYYT